MRGFPAAEFQRRTARAQSLMRNHGLAALLLTTEPEVRYFTGYLTRFWESPTRPWFLIVPASGKPVAVIPSIGAALMEKTWISDIRTWSSPDLSDDGISLLADALCELTPDRARIGLPSGHETHIRMPWNDLKQLQGDIGDRQLGDDADIVTRLRRVKSNAEIAKIKKACTIAGRAFDRVHEVAQPGRTLAEVFRGFQQLCLGEGADWVPYLAGGAGPFGYDDVISPASDQPLARGDILMLDTGLVHDGYFCDYDRNFAVGEANPTAQSAHTVLLDATQAGFEVAKTGATAADLFHAMNAVLTRHGGASDAGRLGHGLGMQLTEWPSLIPTDHTVLEPGMVLTLEPGIETRDGAIMVHEENIVVTENGAAKLSPFASGPLPVI